jgi:hypothetical protein
MSGHGVVYRLQTFGAIAAVTTLVALHCYVGSNLFLCCLWHELHSSEEEVSFETVAEDAELSLEL